MIEVNEAMLYNALLSVLDDMSCRNCPWDKECDEADLADMTTQDCVKLAMECLQGREENHD